MLSSALFVTLKATLSLGRGSDVGGNLLQDFLAEQAALPGRWGERDCCMFVSDWILLRMGTDLSIGIRGSYKDHFGACKIVKQRGGFVKMVEAFASSLGLDLTDDPMTGDVGVIVAPTEIDTMPEMLAIRSGKLWCSRCLHGIIAGPYRCVKAWRVP